jgi:hypothetical protein
MLNAQKMTAARYLSALKDYEHKKAEAIEVVGLLRTRRTNSAVFAQEIDTRLFRWHASLMHLFAAADASGKAGR